MTPTLYLRRAELADVDTIYRWRDDTAKWLADAFGSDQWSTPYPRNVVEGRVAKGETVMASLEPDGAPIATITVSADGDPSLWTDDELAVPARYIYKANVVRAHAGDGIGSTLLKWASTEAAEAGAELLRIDVWTTNLRLHDYYRRHGFRFIRVVPGTVSGALFDALPVRYANLPVIEDDLDPAPTAFDEPRRTRRAQ